MGTKYTIFKWNDYRTVYRAIFSQKIWNKRLQIITNLLTARIDERPFVSEMDDKTVINSLNLNRVYIITSSNSASASEMLINGLSPLLM